VTTGRGPENGVHFTYNALGQETQQAIQNGVTTNMTWDNLENLLTKSTVSQTTTYTYTADNQVATVADTGNYKTTFSYDVDGNETQQAYPNGVTESMSYNTAGQLTRIWATNSGGTTLTSFTYSYTNPNTNQPTDVPYSVTDVAGKTTSYTYDAATELTQAVQTSSSGGTLATYTYAYDPVGNKTSQNLNGASTTLTYNAANELTQASGAINKTFSWDANGSQTGDSTGTSMTYNTAHQLTGVTPSGGSTEVMGYSGPGTIQRVAAGSTTYQRDLTGISKLSSGITTTDMVTIPNYGKPVEESVQGVGYYFIYDGQGNVVMVTNSQGNVANQYSYDPQGNFTTKSETVSNPIGFDYLYVDPATGMWFLPMGALYDPTTGHTTQFLGGFHPSDLGNPAAYDTVAGLVNDLMNSLSSAIGGSSAALGSCSDFQSRVGWPFPNPIDWLRNLRSGICSACKKVASWIAAGIVGGPHCGALAVAACTAAHVKSGVPFSLCRQAVKSACDAMTYLPAAAAYHACWSIGCF
jgi:YD repeat-containing protein